MIRRPPRSTLFPLHDALPISISNSRPVLWAAVRGGTNMNLHRVSLVDSPASNPDRKSTRLNSSHQIISYAVFCLKKKKKTTNRIRPPHLHTASDPSALSPPPY